MKLIYTHANNLIVLNAKNIVEASSIKVFLKNEFSSAGVGELPPIDNWLELWVVEDLHYERAQKLLAVFNSKELADWQCVKCAEINGAAFDYCWNCTTSSHYCDL
ncbi:MAG: DUF2007 domain-containing protein [Pseudomonadales bacterium]|nr:DUF2007 domain-containing protein [Pseudomonadales bacterium]MCJ8337508.1 DUF2007 domain-containing protein [Pseudomonadales bacterium]NRA15128.1 DUF2007 domain-containing protein [Oceanospirillaceae bacterium]